MSETYRAPAPGGRRLALVLGAALAASSPALAQDGDSTDTVRITTTQGDEGAGGGCDKLPDHAALTEQLKSVVKPGDKSANGGLGNNMWAAAVDRSGATCVVTYSGDAFGDQWPGSRAIAIAKAFTANAYSLPDFALSTANLYWPSQPTNALYGLVAANPFAEEPILSGEASDWGTENDPAIGERVGGEIVFAGGLALYDDSGELLGALGLSGDQSCTDHVIAWKVRDGLGLDNVPKGVTKAGNDNIVYDLGADDMGRTASPSGYGHPQCSSRATEIAKGFSQTHPIGPND